MYKFSLKQITVILALIASETIAQSFINNGITGQFNFISKNTSIVAGMISNSIVALIYYMLIKTIKEDDKRDNALNAANSILNVGIQISIAVVSWAVFGEKMTIQNWLGVILMVLGLTLIL
tara:strand:- start:460 stop:822 length:363 start_codon:yes stop_codon:yes gene_type:complete